MDADDLVHIERIRQLKARYFRLMDTKQWDALAQLFTEDALVDSTGEGGPITHGGTEFVIMLRSNIEAVTTAHHGHMPELHLTSATTAEGIWAMEDELFWPAGSPIAHLHGYGHYHETYTRLPETGDDVLGGWRISSMRITRLHRVIELADGTVM